MYVYIYIYIYTHIYKNGATQGEEGGIGTGQTGTYPNGYLGIFLASSLRMYLNRAVLKCVLAWRTRYIELGTH